MEGTVWVGSLVRIDRVKRWEGFFLMSLLCGVLVYSWGCGPGSALPGFHDRIHQGGIGIGASAKGQGSLVASYDFTQPVPLDLSASLGGFLLYSSTSPGFDLLRFDRADRGQFALPAGVLVRLQLVAADPGAQLKLESKTLRQAGDFANLGTTPSLHAHGEWQVAVPEDAVSDSYLLVFKLTTDRPEFSESPPYEIRLQVRSTPEG